MMKMGAGGLGTVSASSHEKACLARRPSPPPAPPSPLAQALWVEERVRTQGQNLNSRTTNRNQKFWVNPIIVPGHPFFTGRPGVKLWRLLLSPPPSFLEFFPRPSSGLNKACVCPKGLGLPSLRPHFLSHLRSPTHTLSCTSLPFFFFFFSLLFWFFKSVEFFFAENWEVQFFQLFLPQKNWNFCQKQNIVTHSWPHWKGLPSPLFPLLITIV